jgi:hypothetical protein
MHFFSYVPKTTHWALEAALVRPGGAFCGIVRQPIQAQAL